MYCAQISDLISAIIIYLCAFVFFLKQFMTGIANRRDERRAGLDKVKMGGEKQ